MSHRYLHAVLDQQLINAINATTLAPVLLTDLAVDNANFTPKVNRVWLAASMQSPQRTYIGAGAGSIKQFRGTYTIAVIVPNGQGTSMAMQLVDVLVDVVFKRQVLVTNDGFRVNIEDATAAPTYPDGPWFRVPVVVSFSMYDTT